MKHALVLLLLARPAVAAPASDPEAERAGDANLETLEKRRGFTFGIHIGPSVTFGADVGTGGALSLRVGQVATPHTVVQLEANASAVVHSVTDTMKPDMPKRLVANSNTTLLAGFQHWLNTSLSIRMGAGIGRYECKECGEPDASGVRATDTYAGIAGSVAVGLDLARWRSLVLSAEVHGVSLLTLEGALWNSSLGLGVSFD